MTNQDALDLGNANEAAPFLELEDQEPHSDTGFDDASRHRPEPKPRTRVLVLLGFTMFCMALCGTMVLVPLSRLTENLLCHQYYGTTEPIEEKRCKVDEVQTKLAWLGACAAMVDSTVSLLVSLPWGILSDSIGRKPILQLAFSSMVLAVGWNIIVLATNGILPIGLIVVSPVFYMFGGGMSVISSVLYSIISDVTTERTTGFVWITIGAMIGGVSGPAIAGRLMETSSPWTPLKLAMGLVPIVYLCTILMPETGTRKAAVAISLQSLNNPAGGKRFMIALRTHLVGLRANLVESLAFLRNRSVALLLVTVFVHSSIAAAQSQTLAQTISRRFGWSLAQTGYLFSVRGVLLIVVLALLSAVSSALLIPVRWWNPPSTFMRDLLLIRAAFIALLVGGVLLGGGTIAIVLSGLGVSTLAAGTQALSRALLAAYVEADHTSSLYVLTGMVETAGSFIASPSLAWAFAVGARLGGNWQGLPFWYAAGLSALTLAILGFVREPAKCDEDE
ncbi:major facilitator superfamily domain-containing protein [Dactylonectria estremocensis]|uniref:Major facilitator superfamily domain-containing protein n=1 Tax=Dactylonectria estremocensis TaxID=1079267 RepID=A0A9P9ES87_9HYPO|nr:major facilitator superfamily domain-containing protein [Dactylonectria estremocensis]